MRLRQNGTYISVQLLILKITFLLNVCLSTAVSVIIYIFFFFHLRRNCRYETDPVLVPYTTTTLDTSEFKPTCRSPTQEMNNYRLMSSRTSRSHDDSVQCDKVDRLASQKEDEKKYVNFVYDITKEIMQSGLYTDKELQDVFKKHIDKNRGILNMVRTIISL